MNDSPLGHWALTGSRPSADVTLILLRVADLAGALLDGLLAHYELFADYVQNRVFRNLLDNRSMEARPSRSLSRTQPFENRLILLIGQTVHPEVQPSGQFSGLFNMQNLL
jgi:hypothetical protein